MFTMPTPHPIRDPRIDAYILNSAEFARPVLNYLRELIHEACPAVEENIKWGMPSFEYKGLLCGMAAFKHHASFGFWKHALVVGAASPAKLSASRGSAVGSTTASRKSSARRNEAMGDFGRITRIADLPARRTLLAYVRKAAKLNDDGIRQPRAPRKPRTQLVVPPDLAAQLRKNKTAAANFKAFSFSKQRDYIDWLTEAKAAETRARRLATALEWIAEGKGRNWKYERR